MTATPTPDHQRPEAPDVPASPDTAPLGVPQTDVPLGIPLSAPDRDPPGIDAPPGFPDNTPVEIPQRA